MPNSNVEAVGKPQMKIPRISVLKLAFQNRVHAAICHVGMVNVPPYLPHSVFRGLFLHPRQACRKQARLRNATVPIVTNTRR